MAVHIKEAIHREREMRFNVRHVQNNLVVASCPAHERGGHLLRTMRKSIAPNVAGVRAEPAALAAIW